MSDGFQRTPGSRRSDGGDFQSPRSIRSDYEDFRKASPRYNNSNNNNNNNNHQLERNNQFPPTLDSRFNPNKQDDFRQMSPTFRSNEHDDYNRKNHGKKRCDGHNDLLYQDSHSSNQREEDGKTNFFSFFIILYCAGESLYQTVLIYLQNVKNVFLYEWFTSIF